MVSDTMPTVTSETQRDSGLRETLTVWMTPGVGPLRLRALLESFGSAERILRAPASALARVSGIGPATAGKIARGFAEAERRADEELARAHEHGVSIVTPADPGYPGLLAALPDAPPILYMRGTISATADRYPVAIVGARAATLYGLEQAGRFGASLAHAGLTVVSGGARGVDTAAHRAAIDAGGRTIAVLGCGLLRAYPEENAPLFGRIADGHGAVVSELPLLAEPRAEHFPARNRLISGISLGVLVVEAGRRSGALITARLAAEDHGREVMAIPGRVDSPSSAGTLELIKAGGAALVTEPGDVIAALEQAAHFAHQDLHADRYPGRATPDPEDAAHDRCDPPGGLGLSERQSQILRALAEPLTPDELATRSGVAASELRAELTMLELGGWVRRSGSRVARTRNTP